MFTPSNIWRSIVLQEVLWLIDLCMLFNAHAPPQPMKANWTKTLHVEVKTLQNILKSMWGGVWFLHWIDTRLRRLNKVKMGTLDWNQTTINRWHTGKLFPAMKNILSVLVDWEQHLFFFFNDIFSCIYNFFYIIVCAFLADGSLLNHRITSEPTVAWLHKIA